MPIRNINCQERFWEMFASSCFSHFSLYLLMHNTYTTRIRRTLTFPYHFWYFCALCWCIYNHLVSPE